MNLQSIAANDMIISHQNDNNNNFKPTFVLAELIHEPHQLLLLIVLQSEVISSTGVVADSALLLALLISSFDGFSTLVQMSLFSLLKLVQ